MTSDAINIQVFEKSLSLFCLRQDAKDWYCDICSGKEYLETDSHNSSFGK